VREELPFPVEIDVAPDDADKRDYNVIFKKAQEKIDAAYKSGCQRFDVAIHGFGGCPMAADDLTGNLATEDLEGYFLKNNINLNLNIELLRESYESSWTIFNKYH
jgi:hydroxymethylglutaryl-CoA lyase